MSIIKKHDYVLRKDNIKLRPMSDNDLNLLVELNSDPDVLYWSDSRDVESYTIDDVIGIYGGVSQNAWCFIIEYDKIDIGECWLQNMNIQYIIDEFPDEVLYRIDISIGKKEYWNRGIGTHVVKMLTKFGFDKQNADKIFYLVEDKNKRSIRTAEKIGYKTLARGEFNNNEILYDLHMMMTRIEYYDLYNS